MCVGPTLLGCRVNFIKNYENFMTYFENKRQISWKQPLECKRNGCNSYFFRMEF